MIDKRVIVLIAILVVAAMIIAVLGFANISFSRGGGESFTALTDKMVETESGSKVLVLPDTYKNGDEVIITDRIIDVSYNGHYTSFYFQYSGTKWMNDTSGTTFYIDQYFGEMLVRNTILSVQLSGDLRELYQVGDWITLKTTVKISSGVPVISGQWTPTSD